MAQRFDVVVIGAGPGGYVAAIKAAQAGKKTAIIEKEALGGICLNWGCIPTKALLKSAEVYETMQHAEDFGIQAKSVKADFGKIIERSRKTAGTMEKGIQFLMRKNDITVIMGFARFISSETLEVVGDDGKPQFVEGDAIIVAAGHKPRTFPNLPIDGERVFHYRTAMSLKKQPKSLLCIGAGAIGMEFGYFYGALGTDVTVVEALDRVLPLEDAELSKFVDRSFKKQRITLKTGTKVEKLDVRKNDVVAHLVDGDGNNEKITVERVLVAVGMAANTEHLGLDDAGIKTDERGFIVVDSDMRTSVPGIYAIGDITGRQLLAHKASFEAEAAVGHIAGHRQPVDYDLIPACTYCQPQVASVGLSEAQAKERGIDVTIGRFQFKASGKAQAAGHAEGFVKLLFDAKYHQLLGAHIVGFEATELLGEAIMAINLESTAEDIMLAMHAHPTMSEALMEAAADALGVCVHQ